jgi:hypothetical protein
MLETMNIQLASVVVFRAPGTNAAIEIDASSRDKRRVIPPLSSSIYPIEPCIKKSLGTDKMGTTADMAAKLVRTY